MTQIDRLISIEAQLTNLRDELPFSPPRVECDAALENIGQAIVVLKRHLAICGRPARAAVWHDDQGENRCMMCHEPLPQPIQPITDAQQITQQAAAIRAAYLVGDGKSSR